MEAEEQVLELQDAQVCLLKWSFDDWKIEVQYQLNANKYAKVKGFKEHQAKFGDTDAPFAQTVKLLSLLAEENSIHNYLMLIKLAWANIQREVNKYWGKQTIKLAQEKLFLSEDSRLTLMAYLIVQTKKADQIYKVYKVVENFVNFEQYEEAAPLSTIETAFHIIILEYSEQLVKKEALSLLEHQEYTDEQLAQVQNQDMAGRFSSAAALRDTNVPCRDGSRCQSAMFATSPFGKYINNSRTNT